MKIKIFEEEFSIKNENEFILLFIKIEKFGEKYSNMIAWNILMESESELLKLIQTYSGFIKILKRLNERNSLLFLNFLSDKLGELIENSHNLSEILANFTSNKGYKTQIIKNLRNRGLKNIIKTGDDFKNTVEWIFGNAENELFNLLEGDYIRGLFGNIKKISEVFYYFNPENKERFFIILGLENICSKIFNYQELKEIINATNSSQNIKILNELTKEKVLNYFYNNKDFYNFLLGLTEEKEKIFLNFLKK